MPNNEKDMDINKDKATKRKKKKPAKKPSKVKRFFKYFFLTILIVGLVIGVTGVGYVVSVVKTTPPLDMDTIFNLNQPSMLFDDKGAFIDNLPTVEERYIVKSSDIPENLMDAYIAIEDERFKTHNGIDIKRILSSIVGNVRYLLTGEGGPQGGSTLTQQLLKNTILFSEASAEDTYLDSINRKIKEITLALQLDEQLSKTEILTAYLNTIPLGGHMYGVEAASRYYFDKSVKDLSLKECAYIAGITQAPSYYSAYNVDDVDYPNTYIDRTELVLGKMLELGFITQEEYTASSTEVAANEFVFSTTVTDYKVNHEWFVYPALDQVKNDLMKKYKYTEDEVDKLFSTGGLKIYTTLDTEMQNTVQGILNDRANLDVDNGVEDLDADGVPLLQASATVMDYRTGHVKVLIGGRGEQLPDSINHAYFDYKSIASTTKPLTVYGPAIDTKTITAGTPIDDTPVSNNILTTYNYGDVIPKNYDGSNNGFITARDAITYSKNLTSIKTVDKIGLETALDYGKKAGLIFNDNSKTMAALATGQYYNDPADRDGGNTTILASAFGSFGNNGVRTEPVLYTKVEDASGKVLLDKQADTVKLFSPQTAYIMYDILKEPLRKFDAYGATVSGIPTAGKTGTTDLTDSFWFAGLTPYYSGSVWIGYANPQRMYGYSSSAANLWGDVMNAVHNGLEYKEIEKPSGLVSASVCIDSGKIPTDLCGKDQRKHRVRTELFIEGTQPKTVCDVHVEVEVNKENNKLATENTPKDLLEKRVFIKKENAYKNADDFKYVVPTEKDDTKPAEKINLYQIGLSKNMDLYDAIVLLNDRKIKYKIEGASVPSSLNPKEFTLVSFTEEIKKGDTVTLKVEVTKPDPGIGNDGDTDEPATPEVPDNNGNEDAEDDETNDTPAA